MCGEADPQSHLFSYVDLESRIPPMHPIRKVRKIVDKALDQIDDKIERMYSAGGRPSIPPEMLIRASLLQILFTIRSERQLIERMDFDLMFRWFVGLGMDTPVWNHSTFSKNRERLMDSRIDEWLLEAIKQQATAKKLLSRDHFTLDGTLLDASASIKPFKRRESKAGSDHDDTPPGGSGGKKRGDFRGEKLSNQTHVSTTDPESKLFRKSRQQGAKLRYMGHLLTDNRHCLIVDAIVSPAGTRQEWGAGLAMLEKCPIRSGQTVGADKGYDTAYFVEGCRDNKITPHVTTKVSGGAVDGRTTRHESYNVSQRKRKQIEGCFGGMKTFG